MNWYKKILIAGKVFTDRELLKALKDFNVIIDRVGIGSKRILVNLNNRKRVH